MNCFLTLENAYQVLQNIRQAGLPFIYDYEKHRLIITDGAHQELLYFRLPLPMPAPDTNLFTATQDIHYVVVLIQSGSCALGYFENGVNRDHKVFRSYMVRMKQGKSQVKYLKTKGKSRAGSRVRLAETVEFFENINQRLQEYFANHQVHRIALSCSKILIPYLFNSKVATPFDKRDQRIYRIPQHIHTPIYEVLLDTNKFLCRGELIYEPAQQSLANTLLEPIRG